MTKPICLLCLGLFIFLFTGCRKSTLNGRLSRGQVVLTFDDWSVDNWYQHLDYLDSLHIRATFYVSSYHVLNAAQKQKLKQIEKRGHEIGYHTSSHANLVKEVARNGMAQTEAQEINPDLTLMRADGYTVNNFAYPYGSHSTQIDNWLLRKFKSVRALCNRQNYHKSLVTESGERQVLYGAVVDNSSRLKDPEILLLMDKAKMNKAALVLVAHQIHFPSSPLQVSRERLLFISRAAAERNLEFVTVNQIVR